MDRLSRMVIRRRKWVIAVFLLLAVVSAVMLLTVRVNYNVVDYLPKEAQSTIALNKMKESFAESMPDARVMIRDISLSEARDFKKKLEAIDGVSNVLWLDDVADIRIPLAMLDRDLVESYYKDGNALYTFSLRGGEEVRVTDEIYALIGEGNALAGDGVSRAMLQRLTGNETLTAMLIVVPLILIILILSTTSWLEPLLFFLAIGIAVVINMGTNIFVGEISFITSAVTPILQMAISLDYAIFLLHSFRDFKEETNDVEEAMRLAMKRAFPAVAASAATTLFGFLALVFMKFRIGIDLGYALAKGVTLSFLTVMIFLPAVTIIVHKWIDKTSHRSWMPSFSKLSTLVQRLRIPALLLTALILVPSFLAQRANTFTYGNSALQGHGSREGQDLSAIDDQFGRSMPVVLMVPRGDVAREKELCLALEKIDHVKNVVGYVTMVGPSIPDAYLEQEIVDQFYSEAFSRIIVYTDTPDEGELAFATVTTIQDTAAEYYSDAYSMGQSVALYDIRNVVTEDNKIVNGIAIGAIFIVLLLTFKSLSLPFLLLITIETAILVNLSISYLSGFAMKYLCYLVVNSVQLGATVDYAILFTDHMMANRRLMNKKDAVRKTLGDTFGSILASALILSLAGFSIGMTSSNLIVSELGVLLGRGTLLSMSMVVLFLPAAFMLFDRLIEKTTLRTVFYRDPVVKHRKEDLR